MTLKDRIVADIRANGPISVADYMARCLFDPADGYYTTREPFGAEGDFVTAPEISQMFGELVAVWLYEAWASAGRPLPVTLAEIGPGRGTLMKDMLRAMGRLDPGFVGRATIFMIEASPRLAEVQRRTLASETASIAWTDRFDALPEQALLLVGNELFDAIPVRQFVRTASGWRERLVAADDGGGLRLVAGAGSLDPGLLPEGAEFAAEGVVFEAAPAREALMTAIAHRIVEDGTAALFFDYGSERSGFGDTLQAVRSHGFADPLAEPGAADLTTHVDFHRLAGTAAAEGAPTRLTTQGEFLLAMGILERAGALGAAADEKARDALRAAVERLADPDRMGTLFKAMAVTAPGLAVPAFPDASPAGPEPSH